MTPGFGALLINPYPAVPTMVEEAMPTPDAELAPGLLLTAVPEEYEGSLFG